MLVSCALLPLFWKLPFCRANLPFFAGGNSYLPFLFLTEVCLLIKVYLSSALYYAMITPIEFSDLKQKSVLYLFVPLAIARLCNNHSMK